LPLHLLRKRALAPVFRCRVEAGKSRAPSDRIASDQPQGEMRPSPSDQTWWARISSASRPNRRDCSSSFDLPAAPPRDNVCFDLFALFGAVRTPIATLTARLLLNYPAQSSKRDTERSGYLFLVKKMICVVSKRARRCYGLATFALLSASPCCAAARFGSSANASLKARMARSC